MNSTLRLVVASLGLAMVTGCEEQPDPAFVYGEQLGGLEFVVFDPDQGVHPNTSITRHPENPFSNGISLETKFEVGAAGVVAGFYGWATALVQEPTGEHQFYAASAARDIYVSQRAAPEDLVYARDIAVRGYQNVLTEFTGAVTYDATGTVAYPLSAQAIDGIVSLGGTVPTGWSVVEDANGVRTAV